MSESLTTKSIFDEIVDAAALTGYAHHARTIIDRARANLPAITKSINDLPALTGEKAHSGIIISAGPSLHKQNSIQSIVESGYQGTIITVDGSYISCLKAGLIPDFVLTLDPHPTRVVRWFGDNDFEKNVGNDDYFKRQDLDVQFRNNTKKQNSDNIKLVNAMGHFSKGIVASTVAQNVVKRIKEAKLDDYWWNPLMDDPQKPDSLTRTIYDMNKKPCLNTGGTVGTAAWVFAHSILKLPNIAVVGMDYGYYRETTYQQTQTYYELLLHLDDPKDIDQCFVDMEFPLTGETFFTDPTYFWYRRNFLDLLKNSQAKTFNCTEAGTLFGDNIECIRLGDFLSKFQN